MFYYQLNLLRSFTRQDLSLEEKTTESRKQSQNDYLDKGQEKCDDRNEDAGRIGSNKRVSVRHRGKGEIKMAYRIGVDGQSIIGTREGTML